MSPLSSLSPVHRGLGRWGVGLLLMSTGVAIPAQGVEVDGGRVTRLPGAGEVGSADAIRSPQAGSSPSFQRLLVAQREALRHPLVDTGGGPQNPGLVLARSRQGVPVTAGDLFLHLCLLPSDGRAQAVVEMVEARDPADRSEARAEVQRALAGYALTHLAPPSLPSGAEDSAQQALRQDVVMARLAHYHRLNTEVRQEAQVTAGDREKFRRENGASIAEPYRLSVRYIQVAASAAETVRGSGHDGSHGESAQARLERIRERIVAGTLSFADAARRYSSAPSRSRGGEIPPFRPGELFSLFEEQAQKLNPGGISPVFPGPGGFYLVQLQRRLPAKDYERTADQLSREEAWKALDRQLDRRAWRNAYAAELREIQVQSPLVDHVLEYRDRRPNERLGQAGKFILSRGQFDQLFPRTPGTGLTPSDVQKVLLLRPILLGAALAQAQEKQTEVPIREAVPAGALAMAQRVAHRMAWDAALAHGVEALPSEKQLEQFHEKNPRLFTPLSPVRVARLRLEVVDPGLATTADASRELATIISALKSGRPPVGAQPLQDQGYFVPQGVLEDLSVFGDVNLATATPQEISEAIGRASQILTTNTVPMNSLDRGAAGLGVGSVPTSVSSDSLTTVTKPGDGATTKSSSTQEQTTATLRQQDGTTTDTRGGGAPDPAEGGMPPKPNIPDFAASQPDKPRQAAKPVKALTLAAKYQSPIYRLGLEDLGWIMLEDNGTIPERVRKLGAGGFTSPRETRTGAEAWHVAERMAVAPLPLERVRAEALDSYQGALYRQRLAGELRRAVRSTGVGTVADPSNPVPPRRTSDSRRSTRP